jgi:hypothetical protein
MEHAEFTSLRDLTAAQYGRKLCRISFFKHRLRRQLRQLLAQFTLNIAYQLQVTIG